MTQLKQQLYSVAHYFAEIASNLNDLKRVDPETYQDGMQSLSEMQKLAGMLDVSVICTSDADGYYDSIYVTKGKSFAQVAIKERI